jgi:predicted  nucleic acid-binding Zn-ribbon protein
MARLVLLVLAPWLISAAKVTPVQQVLNMLEDMKAKGVKATAVEKMIFADYEEWVDDETTKLSQEIETGKNSISKLTAFVEKAESDVSGLKSAIAKLDGEIATNEGEKKAATAQREEEHAEYVKVAADYQESVDALGMAIQTLKNQDYDRPQAMLQLQKMAGKVRGMRHVLAALLEMDDTKAAVHGAPDVAAYEFQSGGIVQVLEKLQDKFQKQLAETESAESNAAHAFDMQVLHLGNLVEESHSDREEKAAVKAKLAGESKAAQGELADTKGDLADDQKTLSDTKVTFSEKKSQFEANQEVRAQELEALGKAIEIIANPTVSQAATSRLVQLPTGGKLSFLQQGSHAAAERALARGNAAEFLRSKAKALSSNVLEAMAADIASNPFAKVVDMIKALLTKLKEEAAGEADHKAWCDKELKKNKMKREKKNSKVNTLTAEVEELDSNIQSMAATIAELSKEQAELAKAMSEATGLRSKEKAKNLSTIKDSEAATAAVKQALVILKDFYSSQAFLQTGKQVPEMAAYKGMQSGNGGVIGMLEVIESDFARLETETRADEAEAAKNYNTFMSESKTAKKQKHDHEYKLSLKKDEAEFQHGQTKKSLSGTQEELDKALSYYEYLKPNCGTVHVSFEERTARRKEEIEALKEAYKILSQKSA